MADMRGNPRNAAPIRFFFLEVPEAPVAYINLTTMMVTAAECFDRGVVKVVDDRGNLDGDIREIRRVHGEFNPGVSFPYFVPA